MRVGIVGIGFMGWIHWLAWNKVPGVEVAAICSREPKKRAGDWTGIQGNFGPPGEKVDLSGLSVFEQFDQMLLDDSIDLIDICLPPGLHCDFAVQAFQAGRHVLCEKPMALTIEQCDQMLQAANKSNRQLLVGHVLPFFPEYAFVRQVALQGQYGSLLGGEFKRTVSNPDWIQGFFDPDIVGGPLIDLHVHDAHFIRALFGMPQSVISSGRWHDKSVEYCASLFNFANSDLVVSSHGGVIHQQGRPFTHAFEVRFERATIQFEFAAFTDQSEAMPLKVLTEDGKVLRPDLGDGDPVDSFVAELTEAYRVVQGQQDESILDGQLARDAIQLCHMQSESVRTGDRVSI